MENVLGSNVRVLCSANHILGNFAFLLRQNCISAVQVGLGSANRANKEVISFVYRQDWVVKSCVLVALFCVGSGAGFVVKFVEYPA